MADTPKNDEGMANMVAGRLVGLSMHCDKTHTPCEITISPNRKRFTLTYPKVGSPAARNVQALRTFQAVIHSFDEEGLISGIVHPPCCWMLPPASPCPSMPAETCRSA